MTDDENELNVHRWAMGIVSVLYGAAYYVSVLVLVVASLGGGAGQLGELLMVGYLGAAGTVLAAVIACLLRRDGLTRNIAAWAVLAASIAASPWIAVVLSSVAWSLVWTPPIAVFAVATVLAVFGLHRP